MSDLQMNNSTQRFQNNTTGVLVNKFVFATLILLLSYLSFANPKEVAAPYMVVLVGIALATVIIGLVEPLDFKFLFTLFMLGFGVRVFLSLLFFLLS